MAREVTAGHMALRASEHNTTSPDPTHHIVAVAPSGDTMWITDSCYEHEPVAPEVKLADEYGDITDEIIDGRRVSHFELREL